MWVSPFILAVYTPLIVNADLLNIIHGAAGVSWFAGPEVLIQGELNHALNSLNMIDWTDDSQ